VSLLPSSASSPPAYHRNESSAQQAIPEAPTTAEPEPDHARRSRGKASVLTAMIPHLLVPLFLAAGMGLAYLGAFHQPEPSHLNVAIVGVSPQAELFAQGVADKSIGELDVRTLATADEALSLLKTGGIAAAYEVGTSHATLFVASAASGTTADIAEKIFLPIAYQQHLPLKVRDVVPPTAHDPSAQGLFFLLVALSVGAYASAVAIAAVTGRARLLLRTAVATTMAALVSGIGITIAGPIYHVIGGHQWQIWLFAWLYVEAIVLLGMGLHPLLRHWTTAALVALFVMLNFTSAGGVYTSQLLPPFFSALSTFWNGAAWLHASQKLLYFPHQPIWSECVTLGLWAGAGLGLLVLTHWWSHRRTVVAIESMPVDEDEEGIAA
jgi:hypothetical protein